jgi:hypothetical protein
MLLFAGSQNSGSGNWGDQNSGHHNTGAASMSAQWTAAYFLLHAGVSAAVYC